MFYGLLPQRFGLSKNTIRELINESPDSLKFFDLKLFEHFFDVNVVDFLLKNSSIVRIKEKEIDFLAEKLGLDSKSLVDFGRLLTEEYKKLDIVLVTRGQNGIFAYSKKEGAFLIPGCKIKMVDNIGSGMAFSAGFLHYYLTP